MDMWNIMVFVAVSVKLILLCITYAIVINIDSIESHSGANSVTTLPWVELECDNYLEVLNKWKIKFRHAYVDNLEHNMEMHCSRWLEHADNQISKQYLSTIREIDELRRGRLDDCLRQGSSSKYVQIASQWNIEDVISNLISEENQYVLISFAQELFNKQLYSHAEAIAYLLLRNGIEDENSHCINRNSDSLNGSEACKRLVLTNEYTIARMTSSLYVILSEVAKVKGLLETANIASQILIYSFQLVSLQQKAIHGVDYIVDRSGWISWIYRLRSILSIPHVPLSFERAISDRKTMLAELSAFVRDIRQINLTISLSSLVSEISATPFHLSHQGLNDKSVQVLLSEAFSTLCPELLHTAANLPPPADKPAFRASLRIGFISAHFFEHSIGRILIGLIERMNSIHLVVDEGLPASKVEVFVFSVDRSLASDIPAEDISSLQSRLPRDGDQIVSLLSATIGDRYFRLPDNITTIRSFIEQTKLDFLMFADIGMDFSTYLLAFSRLAPFQAAWWGHPITSGIESIDFFFSLEDELPAADSHYSEQLVRFDTVNSMNVLPIEYSETDKEAVFEAVGLPGDAKICMVLGRLFKLHPEFDEILISILYSAFHSHELQGRKSTVYIVLIAERIYEYNHHIMKRLRDFLIARDSALTVQQQEELLMRIRFVHLDAYYRLLPFARAVLDTFPYGGCLTTHDALSNGIPMVTLPAEFIRGRFTLGMYRQMEHFDLVATDKHMYVDLALRLVWDDEFFHRQKREILWKFQNKLLKNSQVAFEWTDFIIRLFT